MIGLNPFFIRSAFERPAGEHWYITSVSIPSSSGPRWNRKPPMNWLNCSCLNPFFIRSAFERIVQRDDDDE